MLKLQDAHCSGPVRAQLMLATADLAMAAAFMTFDVEQHETARRLWMIGLDTARHADHPRSGDLTVILLLDLACQALHLGRPQEALRLAQLGAATAASHRYPVSASTRSYLAMYLAWCHAALGDTGPCRRALAEAQQHYTDADPTTAPPWAAHVTPAEIAAQHGNSLSLLANTHAKYAPAAVEHLRHAVDSYGPTYARSRAVNLPGLAASYFNAGDLDSALTTGHQAVTEISALSSKRTYARLRTLAETASRFEHHSGVTELDARIRKALATAA